MYLQITTRCNMTCAHCCYSCRPGAGKHADYHDVIDAIAFSRDYGESIAIGGGEPTLHPRFFDILRHCLQDFNYVWMATNGSNEKAMRRLSNIIEGNDFESFEREDYCCCDDADGCCCEPKGLIYQEDKLSVALSQDPWHDRSLVKEWVVDRWTQRSKRQGSHYEIRNVSQSMDGAAEQGRAKRTGAGWSPHCVCSDHIIRPDGKIKLCGCTASPIIGTVRQGIDRIWEEIISSDDKFNGTNCYRDLSSASKRALRRAA